MPIALEHVRRLGARDQRTIVDTVDEQLRNEPDSPTRRRKPLRPNALAAWELRIGDFRVFYEILRSEESDDEQQPDEPTVAILAVGLKRGNRLFIEDEEVEL